MSDQASAPTGVLLVQLGTPDAPTPAALRRYLAEFLGDPRVIDLPPVLRWLLLHGIILRFRPRTSARLYARVWTEEGSPLLLTSRAQAAGVAQRLGPSFVVRLGMRYGNPALAGALDELVSAGCRRVLLVPLFPQYSCATTASVYDAAFTALLRYRAVPTLRVAEPFHRDSGYVAAVAARVRERLGDRLARISVLFSFHGIPLRYAEAGDPYPLHCQATADAIAEDLGLAPENWHLSYQSRFGREEWLRPYTDKEFERLAAENGGDLAVLCPGFVADCLETIDEIGEIGAEQYRSAGGGELILVPCVNDHPRWLDALAAIVRRECAGWE